MSPNPTLKTIRMVEDVIKNHPDSIVKIPDLKRLLPKKVNHNILMEILSYLEENLKIYMSVKGITWTHTTKKELKQIIKNSTPYDEIFSEK